MLPNRIPPDVIGDFLGRIGTAEDMVVVALLPKASTIAVAELENGARFEDTNEFHQIGQRMIPLREQVHMVGHEAVGVQNEGVSRGTVDETFADHFGGFGVGQVGLAEIAT